MINLNGRKQSMFLSNFGTCQHVSRLLPEKITFAKTTNSEPFQKLIPPDPHSNCAKMRHLSFFRSSYPSIDNPELNEVFENKRSDDDLFNLLRKLFVFLAWPFGSGYKRWSRQAGRNQQLQQSDSPIARNLSASKTCISLKLLSPLSLLLPPPAP